ncbi:MAG: hypothetical protein AAGG38_08215 [Planctomycetota bacterium]
MKYRWPLALIVLLGGFVPGSSAWAAESELDLLRAENAALRQQVEALGVQVRILQARLNAASSAPDPAPAPPAAPAATPPSSTPVPAATTPVSPTSPPTAATPAPPALVPTARASSNTESTTPASAPPASAAATPPSPAPAAPAAVPAASDSDAPAPAPAPASAAAEAVGSPSDEATAPAADTDEMAALRSRVAELEQSNAELSDRTQALKQEGQALQALAGVATDQDVVDEQNARIRQNYDRRADRTKLTFGPEELTSEGSPGTFYVSVVASHPGTAAPADAVDVSLFLQSDRANTVFRELSELTFLVNGRPEVFAVENHDISYSRTGLTGKNASRRSRETVTLRPDVAALARLGEARTLTLSADGVTLTFERDARAGLRATAGRLSPAE